MKNCLIALTLFSLLMTACGKGYQINARNLQSAQKSVIHFRERLPAEERIQFEAAYWTLRDEIKNSDEFLKAIDGKTPKELITMGKESFTKRKAAGDQQIAAYANWEQMIAQSAQQRGAQDNGADPRDKKGYPRVDYKMHAM